MRTRLRRPQMEEIGDRVTTFGFGDLLDRQRDYLDQVPSNSVEKGVAPDKIMSDAVAARLGSRVNNASADQQALGART